MDVLNSIFGSLQRSQSVTGDELKWYSGGEEF